MLNTSRPADKPSTSRCVSSSLSRPRGRDPRGNWHGIGGVRHSPLLLPGWHDLAIRRIYLPGAIGRSPTARREGTDDACAKGCPGVARRDSAGRRLFRVLLFVALDWRRQVTAEEIREHIQRVGALDFCGVNIAEAQVALAKLQVGVLGEIALQLAIQNDL